MTLLSTLAHGGWLRDVDVALADSLQRIRPDTGDLVRSAAALASRGVAHGHSQLPLGRIAELLLDIDADQPLPTLPSHAQWLEALQASPWVRPGDSAVSSPLVLEDDRLWLRRYWSYETRLAAAIAVRVGTKTRAAQASQVTDAEFELRLAQLFPVSAQHPLSIQAEAARAMRSQRLLLLTGGPGTGKTTTVARALVVFAEYWQGDRPPRIVLAAPTGKAAARLGESVRENLAQLVASQQVDAGIASALPTQAMTLHRLLGWQRGLAQFRHDARHPVPADLVIVDEASMIDLPLMCKLFEAVAADATLVLIGDRDQLPSVETGDVLAALCDAPALQPGDGAQASSLRVHLQVSHRQRAQVEVGVLAAWVRDGDATQALDALEHGAVAGVQWRTGEDRSLADAVRSAALPAFRAVAEAGSVEEALRIAKQFRILTAVREGPAGSQTLNALLGAALDPERNGEGFFHGRLLLITENSYRQQLFNGDIGVVWVDANQETRVWFEGEAGPRALAPAALPGHESAFALTVHKSQGSEFERIWLVLPARGARVISRELLYTGLTRCREHVTLWANAEVLREGIARRAQRWSGLAERL